MFLSRDFVNKGSHYLPGKNKSFNILLKMHKTNTKQ